MTDSMPLRLHHGVSIIPRTRDPDAGDAQAACAETAACIIVLEAALTALLAGQDGATE